MNDVKYEKNVSIIDEKWDGDLIFTKRFRKGKVAAGYDQKIDRDEPGEFCQGC